MLTKVTKHSKNKFTSKETKLSTIRFCRALDNSKKKTLLLWGACPYLTPFYLIVMDCWKYCKGYKFALSVACSRAKKLSASGGSAPRPCYRLALHALAMWPQKLPMALVPVPWRGLVYIKSSALCKELFKRNRKLKQVSK